MILNASGGSGRLSLGNGIVDMDQNVVLSMDHGESIVIAVDQDETPDGTDLFELSARRTTKKKGRDGAGRRFSTPGQVQLRTVGLGRVGRVDVLEFTEADEDEDVAYDAGILIEWESGDRVAIVAGGSFQLSLTIDATGVERVTADLHARKSLSRWIGPYDAPWGDTPIAFCRACRSRLRTALAQQCLECGMDWHDSVR